MRALMPIQISGDHLVAWHINRDAKLKRGDECQIKPQYVDAYLTYKQLELV